MTLSFSLDVVADGRKIHRQDLKLSPLGSAACVGGLHLRFEIRREVQCNILCCEGSDVIPRRDIERRHVLAAECSRGRVTECDRRRHCVTEATDVTDSGEKSEESWSGRKSVRKTLGLMHKLTVAQLSADPVRMTSIDVLDADG